MTDLSAGTLLAIAARTVIVLVVLVAGMRVLGKRHIGAFSLYDLILVLLVANAVQNAMTAGNGHFLAALVSAGTLLLLGWAGAGLLVRRPALERRWMGGPAVLVWHGSVIAQTLRRESITRDEVLAELRKQGLEHFREARLVVLEIDGSISVVPASPTMESAAS